MLTSNDIQFIVASLNKVAFQGLDANHKVVEVFLKLQQLSTMAKLIEEKEGSPAVPPIGEQKVSENEGTDADTPAEKAVV